MILAMAVNVLLVFIVGTLALHSRIRAVKQGEINIKAFRLMDDTMPERVAKTTRNFNNQFEVPTLFYTAAVTHLVIDSNSSFALICAWLFVASRYVHSAIHITYNHLLHRMLAFWFGIITVIAMWTELVIISL